MRLENVENAEQCLFQDDPDELVAAVVWSTSSASSLAVFDDIGGSTTFFGVILHSFIAQSTPTVRDVADMRFLFNSNSRYYVHSNIYILRKKLNSSMQPSLPILSRLRAGVPGVKSLF